MLKSELPRAGSMAFHPVLDCFFEAFQGHVTHRHSLLQIHCEQRRPMLASSCLRSRIPNLACNAAERCCLLFQQCEVKGCSATVPVLGGHYCSTPNPRPAICLRKPNTRLKSLTL